MCGYSMTIPRVLWNMIFQTQYVWLQSIGFILVSIFHIHSQVAARITHNLKWKIKYFLQVGNEYIQCVFWEWLEANTWKLDFFSIIPILESFYKFCYYAKFIAFSYVKINWNVLQNCDSLPFNSKKSTLYLFYVEQKKTFIYTVSIFTYY